PAIGQPAVITTGPPDPLLTIVNKVITSAKGVRREISIHRGLNDNTITITGTIPLDDRGYTGGIGISHPALLFVYLLRNSLAAKGVVVTGKARATGEVALSSMSPVSSVAQEEIVAFQSPPFSVIAAQTLKPSQNL